MLMHKSNTNHHENPRFRGVCTSAARPDLRAELARKIAWFIGSSERQITAVPGLLLVRRTAPSAPCSGTYQPSVIVIAQGRKSVDLGQTTFVYDRSRFLTAVDLPIVSQVLEASEAEPLLALALKLEMSVVRELLSREEVHVRDVKAIAWIRDNYTKQVRVDDLADIAGMGVSTLHHHFRVLTNLSPLQYQKQLRLQTARGRMLVDGMDASTVAIEVGYESVSQFNREYSRFFGQPPDA